VNNNNNNNNNNKDIEQLHQHLTQFEIDGLQTLCTLLRKLKDKSIPEDLVQPQQLLDSMEVNSPKKFASRDETVLTKKRFILQKFIVKIPSV
jgi:hypothetical protein